ncbi:MAG TPA: DUF4124 domain-containing protein [Xanthomonadaceae bacterium]|jgi:hypothetical protein
MRNHPPIRSSLARFSAPIALALAFALLASTAASAADQAASPASPAASPANPAPPPSNVVYKWKDEHGISQYSQQPPPKGVKFETIENSATPPTDPGASSQLTGQN